MRHGIARMSRQRLAILAAFVLVAPVLFAVGRYPAWAAVATSVTIDGTKGGRTFDGIGAISGGGGNSRLLFDYPEPQRSQILDYLFKPGVGANIQLFKVEIGGDTNSTDGAEKSHMHSPTDLNCDRGYEWWLMEQAKARNPAIKLAALSWGAPGWVGSTFWTDDTISYLIKWLDCARSRNLNIDYMGGWNEKGFDKAWYIKFHAALAANYPGVKLVGDDGNKGWLVADAMATDAAFARSVDVLGIHYSCGYTGTDKGKSCLNSTNARNTGKPLWASETGSQNYNTGVFASVRSYNRGYIDARMTGYMNWNLIAALTPNLRFNTVGLMLANEPWSGAYSVGKVMWGMAHTTQFTAPGWKYIDSASGYLGGNRDNGSYVTLRSPNNRDYSTIIETIDATDTNTVTVNVTGGLSTGAVHVWTTNANSNNTADHFVRQADVTPSGGRYTLSLQPGRIYSITTTTGQGKATARGPAAHGLNLPYSDNFDGYGVGKEARYLADMDGAFEVVNCGGGRAGRCVRQMAPQAPILWRSSGGQRDPSALLGDTTWRDVTFSIDSMMNRSGYVQLEGRVGTQGGRPTQQNAYFLRVNSNGNWSIIKSDTTPTLTTLASGTTTAPGTNTWHRYTFAFVGSRMTGSIDGRVLGSATDTSYAAGQVGIANSQWINSQWDNLSITGSGGPPPDLSGTYKILNDNSGLALSVAGGSTANRALIEQATDSGAAHQQWRLTAVSGSTYTLTNVGTGKVLDVPSSSTTPGTQLIQFDGNGGVNQQWDFAASGSSFTITSRLNGLRVDVKGNSTAIGAAVIQWSATGGANQRWHLVRVS
jgi:Glycosyl hydrolase family 59/Ricin-type beta-trefoil lectin domain-like